LLKLLLALLEFLKELLWRFDVLLSILLLLIVASGCLIVCLVGLIGLIVGLRVIGAVGGIVGRIVLGIFAFNNDSIGAWRGSHGRQRAGKHGLVARSSLLYRRRWSAVG
jgi:xanthosine utilization system XapX-like protein